LVEHYQLICLGVAADRIFDNHFDEGFEE